MEYVVFWLIGSAISWVLLVVAMFLAHRFAAMSLPPLGPFLGKTAGVVLISNALALALEPFLWIGGTLIAFGTFCLMMMKLFDLEFWQLMVIAITTWLLRAALVFLLF